MPRDKQTEFHYNLALIIYVTLYEPKEALREPLDCLASARATYRASRPTRHPPAVRVHPTPLRTSRKEAHAMDKVCEYATTCQAWSRAKELSSLLFIFENQVLI